MIIALIVLILITVLGMSGIRSITLEQKMTSNSIDRNMIFQVSEWALGIAETVAEEQAKLCNSGFVNQGAPEDFNVDNGLCKQSVCQNGLCSFPNPNCINRWSDSSFNGWSSIKDPKNSFNPFSHSGLNPQFMIEYLHPVRPSCHGLPTDGPFMYRITVQTAAGENRATVILQSLYGE